jgi:hypothetical protein
MFTSATTWLRLTNRYLISPSFRRALFAPQPGAQSAIFMPLLACMLGPIEGFCTAEQLALAQVRKAPCRPRCWADFSLF